MASYTVTETVTFFTDDSKYKNDDCTICRQSLTIDSIYGQENNKISSIKTGKCGHSFHKECIEPWNKINRNCPICVQPF
jgi:hypothetical protein